MGRKSISELTKRMAAQVAAMLPEDRDEAIAVLELARDIVICLGSDDCDRCRRSGIRLVSERQAPPVGEET